MKHYLTDEKIYGGAILRIDDSGNLKFVEVDEGVDPYVIYDDIGAVLIKYDSNERKWYWDEEGLFFQED